ncbi:MAG TPA: hypothetical protein VF456_04140 [Vicinamibacterales bacterium]
MRKIRLRWRCCAGTFAKYCASATMPSAPFSSFALQPSVWVLMMMFSSLCPGRIAHRLSLGVSGCVTATIVNVAEAPDAASLFKC